MHVHAKVLRELVPVPVAHARVAQCAGQRHVGPEGVHLLLDLVAAVGALGQVAVHEHLGHLEHILPHRVYVPLQRVGVDRVERPVHPGILAVLPFLRGPPQVGKRLEVLDQHLDLAVVRERFLEEALAAVEESGRLLGLLELLCDLLDVLGDGLGVPEVRVHAEAPNGLRQVGEIGCEALLLLELRVLVPRLVVRQALLGDRHDAVDAARPAVALHLLLEVPVAQLHLARIEGVVVDLDRVELVQDLRNLHRNLADELALAVDVLHVGGLDLKLAVEVLVLGADARHDGLGSLPQQRHDLVKDLLLFEDESLANPLDSDADTPEGHGNGHVGVQELKVLLVLVDLPRQDREARAIVAVIVWGHLGLQVRHVRGHVERHELLELFELLQVRLRVPHGSGHGDLEAVAEGAHGRLHGVHAVQHGFVAPEERLHDHGLERGDGLHRRDPLVEDAHGHGHKLLEGGGVDQLPAVVDDLEGQQRRLLSLDRRGPLLHNHHLRGGDHLHLEDAAPLHKRDESLRGCLHQVAQRIFHNILGHVDELLQLGALVGLLLRLVQIEPALAHVLEGGLDSILERHDPHVLEVRHHLVRGLQLALLELFQPRGLGVVRVKQAHLEHLVALRLDLDAGRDDLGFGEERVEGELRELLRVVVGGEAHGAALGHLLRLGLRELLRQGHEHLGELGAALEALIEHDLVHRARVLDVDLVDQLGGVSELVLELLAVESKAQHTVDLLHSQGGDVLRGHAVDVQAVAQHAHGARARGVRLPDAAREHKGILGLEVEEDARVPVHLHRLLPELLHSLYAVHVLLFVEVEHHTGGPRH
mmetsp:Transcript_66600/g.210871  ORF Transcript_66600/g.210871 Transcript_66600/m.210871 type:complete len:818 (+) Transcript_66600:308-2761(+)